MAMLEDVLGQYNQSNFDIGSAAALIRQLGQQVGLSEEELAAAVPVFGNEHRAAYNSGYTEGSNYSAVAQRAVADALDARGVDSSRFKQATQGFVDQGAQQAQQRWQATQKPNKGLFGDLGPIAKIAALFPGPQQPFLLAANAANSLSQGDLIGAGTNALGAYGGFGGNNMIDVMGGTESAMANSPSYTDFGGSGMVDVMGGTESAMANSPAGTASGLGMLQRLMSATGLSEKQLTGLGSAGLQSLASLYGARQVGRAATNAANIGVNAADRATALQREQYDQTRADLAPYRTAGTNALARLTAGTEPGGEFTKTFSIENFLANKDPSFDYMQDQARKAQERSAAARGGLLSGGTLLALGRDASSRASQEYQNAFNRYQTNRSNILNPLQSLAGVGQTSTNQGISAGQNFATNVGNLGMGAASNQADAGLAAARANQSAYGAIGNAFSNYLSPNPMNTFFQNQLNKNLGA